MIELRTGKQRFRDKRSFVLFLFFTVALATGLTLFYFVHEQLPRFARAPSALLLAPVAVTDGLCHLMGIAGIYGRAVPIFIVNCVFAFILCGIGYLALRRWRRDQ